MTHYSKTCSMNHSWESKRKDSKCPYCTNRKVLEGFNDAGCLYPNLISEWSPSNDGSLHDYVKGSNKNVEWVCVNSHVWMAPIASRTKGAGCRKCFFEQAKTDDLWNNRATKFLKNERPELFSEVVNKAAHESISFSSHKKIEWKCSLGHLYKLSPNVRIGGRGCPYCANRKVLIGFNDFATVYPELAKELVDPFDSYREHWFRDHVEWFHITDDGNRHKWTTTMGSRVSGTSCLICTNRIVLIGFNDVATTHPDIAAQWSTKNTIQPNEVTRGSNELVELICPKGHEWSSKIKTATSMSKVCIDCKPTSDYFRSKAEIELCNFVETLTEVESSVKRFKKYGIYEIDIFCPNEKIAIDYNGIYYHQEEFKGEGYHEAKRDAMADQGFHHIEVWEDSWMDDKDTVLRQIEESVINILRGDSESRHFQVISSIDRLRVPDMQPFGVSTF